MTQVLKSNGIQKPRRLIEAARVRGKRRNNDGQKTECERENGRERAVEARGAKLGRVNWKACVGRKRL